jgi:hypothetical protein
VNVRVSMRRMVTPAVSDDAGTFLYPRRFHSARERNERLGRWLRIAAGVTTVDERLLDRLGRRMFARDELGAQLVTAMRRPKHDPERVVMAQFKDALADGIDAVPDAPQALRDFFAVVDDVPDWVDFDFLERGARAFRRLGRSRDDVLLQLALIGGYRFAGPADLLVRTGGLTGSHACVGSGRPINGSTRSAHRRECAEIARASNSPSTCG